MTEPKKPKGGLAILIGMKGKPKESEEPMAEEMGETPEMEAAEGEHQSTDEGSTRGAPDEGGHYLTLPKNFQAPDDKQMGQEFNGTYRGYVTEDGRLCVTAINGIELDGSQKPQGAQEGSGEAEEPPTSEQAAEAPANAQDEGGAIESTPHVKESKRLKALLNGR